MRGAYGIPIHNVQHRGREQPELSRPEYCTAFIPIYQEFIHTQPQPTETHYGWIVIGVPSGTAFQMTSMSALATAMQPSVQSPPAMAYQTGVPWMKMSPPGDTP